MSRRVPPNGLDELALWQRRIGQGALLPAQSFGEDAVIGGARVGSTSVIPLKPWLCWAYWPTRGSCQVRAATAIFLNLDMDIDNGYGEKRRLIEEEPLGTPLTK